MNEDVLHFMFACSQTAAVSKHVTECVLLIHSIFQMIFYNSAYAFFSPHTETRVQKQLREEFLPDAEGYLHQAMSSASAVSYFRVPVPRPALHHSLDDAQRHISLGGKMVITQDLVAIIQVFSRGRSREGGKGGENPTV